MTILCLSGGVGGARFAEGLQRALPSGHLSIVVNTADDFDYLGLRICPDLDSVLYSLGGLNDTQRGWGRSGETWECQGVLKKLGDPAWFALGDRDLAIHLIRTKDLHMGKSLAQITQSFAAMLSVPSTLIPMTEDRVMTVLQTNLGRLEFQDFFVKQRGEPIVKGITYEGIESSRIHPQLVSLLQSESLQAILIAPSNPYLSIDPILSIPGMRDLLKSRRVPCIAISPLVGGNAVKGPLGEMLDSLEGSRSPEVFIRHYEALIDGFVVDISDESQVRNIDLPCRALPTLMTDADSRLALAKQAFSFASSLRDH